ncbi:MAG TPA: biopolymer transporter ExbD [Gammaproteobacteria bacterium]|nr:biopolymer transporter ExbD [Gammaproteobacteria bacterium]
MNLRRPRPAEPELNLIPLIDVVFMLLIFFIVTTTFNRDTAMSINLPEANAEPLKVEDKLVEISIDAEGRYFINREPIINADIENLKRALLKAAGELKSPPLVISADAKTPHQAVISAMDAARQLGFVHLTFATQTKAPAP